VKDELFDLASSLQTSAVFGRSSDLFPLVDLDEDLGYLHVASKALATRTAPMSQALLEKMAKLDSRLSAVRKDVADALALLAQTGETAELALDEAATCQGVDLRDLARPRGKVGRVDPAEREKALHVNEPIVASKACESAVRLWGAARTTDLTSVVTSSSVATHITELTLTGATSGVRDKLAHALQEHAKALRRFGVLAGSGSDAPPPDVKELLALRSDLVKALDETTRTCRAETGDLGRVLGGSAEPRRATVTVRPKWPKSLESFPHPIEFGSGFVVRWRSASGTLESRIVTNNHVMDGAFEAEIVSGDPKLARPDASEKSSAWSATLVQSNPHDDVAVLKLDAAAEPVFSEGFALRLAPAKEEEGVVAAGFPGIGARPSFQVTKGTVSNARFNADGAASGLDVYVQHTAAIDPGNSGGPLLDGHDRILGMNTFKLVGRENVGLAIPTWRIQEALVRSEEAATLDTKHAEASCNAVVGAFSSAHPVGEAASRFGLPLYEWAEAQPQIEGAAMFSEQMREGPGNPVDAARRRAYGTLRAIVEAEGGVRPFEACSDVRAGDAGGTVVATFRTRRKSHTLTFAEEHAVMRVVAFK
jgi:S1-C subfamily serine protease